MIARSRFDETPDARNAILEKKKFTLKSVLSTGAQHNDTTNCLRRGAGSIAKDLFPKKHRGRNAPERCYRRALTLGVFRTEILQKINLCKT